MEIRKAVDLMMDWAHGPAGHFGGHAVPGLHHINIGGTIIHKWINTKILWELILELVIITKLVLRQPQKLNVPTINILGEYDRMIPIKEGKKLASIDIRIQKIEIIPKCGHMILLGRSRSSFINFEKVYYQKSSSFLN